MSDEQNVPGAESTPTEAQPNVSTAENNVVPEVASGTEVKTVDPADHTLTGKDILLNPHLQAIGLKAGDKIKVQYVHSVRFTLSDGRVLMGQLSDDDTDFVGTRPGKGRNG